jgi:glycosyltransferase involved in cell wall biosynthesis
MDVSLIICTRDRCKQLRRCLEAVRRLSFSGSWELVIVDNGSLDETTKVIQQFSRMVSVPVIYVLETTSGLGNAHNAAIRHARGEILAFTDDDCYPEPDFLQCIWESFTDLSIGYITGRIMLHDRADYPLMINESLSPRTFAGGSFLRAGWVHGANMAFRGCVLGEIGGFDALFGPGAYFNAEDVEAASRASSIGWKGRYCPEVIVRHHHGRTRADAVRLLRSYGIGRGAYHMKLLLNERRFSWFARSVYELWWWRIRWEREAPLWESVGGIKYAYMYLLRASCYLLSRRAV